MALRFLVGLGGAFIVAGVGIHDIGAAFIAAGLVLVGLAVLFFLDVPEQP